MEAEDDVLTRLQHQIAALQTSRQQQLERDVAKADAEAELRRKAVENAQGLVKLNIGGVRYVTSLATLIAVSDTYFTALFSGDWQQVLTAEGEVYIDRDGEASAPFNYFISTARWIVCSACCVRSPLNTSCSTFELHETSKPTPCQRACMHICWQPLSPKRNFTV